MMGQDGVVSVTIQYGLDCPGIESLWGQCFPHVSTPSVGPTQPPVQCVVGHSRVKVAGAWC